MSYSERANSKSARDLSKSISNVSGGEYSTSSFEGPSCPRVYEEIIQELEADIRKHIRMEH